MTDQRIITDEALDLLFREARTHKYWLDKPVSDSLLQAVYELAKMGPTANNSQPMRVVFVKSPDAKARLIPYLDEGNIEKVKTAPVTAIIAHDEDFYKKMGEAGAKFEGKDMGNYLLRNGSLQGAYFMLAARALGLDCGPMSGFKLGGVTQEFLEDKKWKANFLCNLGYGDKTKLSPRGSRLSFDDACAIL